MTATHISFARDDAETGVSMVPTLIPLGWTGLAASACQTDLDDAHVLLGGLDALLTAAYDAAAAVDDAAAG